MSDFTSLLARLPEGMNKRSGIESPDQVQLEQDFGRMAYSFLKDRAPDLIPFMVGFETVDRNDEGDRAVGIFGFKIGNDFYYVPAFFLNGQVRGLDLLYSKRTNNFMPLRESWISYIVNRQTIRLGEGNTEPDIRQQFESPRFDFLAVPPVSPGGITKFSSADDVAHDGFGCWNQMQETVVNAMDNDPDFQAAWVGAVARLEKAAAAEPTIENSRLLEYLENSGGPMAVTTLLDWTGSNQKFAEALLTFYPSVESVCVQKFAAALQPVKQAAKLEVVTEKREYLDGKDTTRLVRDGFTIVDSRDPDEKSEVYETDYTKRFWTPTKSGLYPVLLTNGTVCDAWVFYGSGQPKSSNVTVVDPKSRAYFTAESGALYVRDDLMVEGKNAYEEAIELTKVVPGGKYLLVDETGNSMGPVEVRAVMSENDKRQRLRIDWLGCYPEIKRPTYGHDFEMLHNKDRGHWRAEQPTSDFGQYLQLANHRGHAVVQVSDTDAAVPSNWRALELREPKSTSDSYEADRAMRDLFRPGSITDVMVELTKRAVHNLMVGTDDRLEYYVRFDDLQDGAPLNYKAAMVRLVGRYGLTVDDAETILKDASDNFKARRLVKLGQYGGQVVSQLGGVSQLPPQQEIPGADPYTGVTTTQPFADVQRGMLTGITPPQNSLQLGFNIGGETQKDQQGGGGAGGEQGAAMAPADLASMAAQSGQKQVFDHAAIGGLSKIYDSGAVIDTYIPDMMKALDRLGRILFLFYWKNEEFANRYGAEDLADIEDMIRGVFKSFGDMVLRLKEKAIGSDNAENSVI